MQEHNNFVMQGQTKKWLALADGIIFVAINEAFSFLFAACFHHESSVKVRFY